MHKKIGIIIGISLLVLLVLFFVQKLPQQQSQLQQTSIPSSPVSTTQSPSINQDEPVTVVAQNLEVPWAIAFLPSSPTGGPDRSMLVTERAGRVRYVDQNGNLDPTPVAILSQVEEIGEGGLLGIALHPDFAKNNYVYLYYTYSSNGNNTFNRVVRMTYKDKKLTDEKIIVDAIPGAANHNGGRIKFGPDNMLYITTGDAQEPSLAQDRNSLAGKILRVTESGRAVANNPFNNKVFTLGHRNPQGLAWDSTGQLWSTEHGRSGVQSGLDELNLIISGKNYGWPTIQGNETRSGMVTPIKNSESTTWAPAGAAFVDGSLFFGGLRGQTLYEAVLDNDTVTEVKEHFNSQFGRIREVVVGPDNMLYITTSNRDGRGSPQTNDDKILRINPAKL